MRQAEIAALEWSWVDQESEAASLYRTKRMRLRTISLCPAAFEILEKQPRLNAQSKVFRDENGDDWRQISSKFCALRRKIEEKNKDFVRFRFHDFRHLYAVNYLRTGGDIYALQKLLGHGSIKTTEGYLAFLTPEQNRVSQFGARAQKRAQATA